MSTILTLTRNSIKCASSAASRVSALFLSALLEVEVKGAHVAVWVTTQLDALRDIGYSDMFVVQFAVFSYDHLTGGPDIYNVNFPDDKARIKLLGVLML